ncbi:MAG: type III pantothenate kinase [Pseudomonadota bacterium]
MMLALDIGNTRVKWGLRGGGGWRESGATDTRPLGTLPQRLATLPRAASVAYCNVAGRGGERAVGALSRRWAARCLRIAPMAASCGVRNGYQEIGQLGSDRWAALVAAWSMVRAPAVVVNAGTAATMDLLDGDGLFLGGIICPGIGLMLESLRRRSRVLRADAGRVEPLPRDTASAMKTGAMTALVGAVEMMAGRLEAHCTSKPVIVLSGGDAPLLTGFASERIVRVENLVLEGVALIADEALRR